jgi:hypothetical protein
MHLLQVTSVADDGHAAFSSIKEWYGSAATIQSIIDHYRKKMEGLKLDPNTTASEYINVFQICCQKLEAKNKQGYTTDTKRQRFLDQMLDDDYDVVKQNLQDNSVMAFNDCVKRIRQREQDLQINAGESLKKARRFKKEDSKPNATNKSSEGKIPSIPNHILYKVKPKNVQRDLVRWRGIWNSEARIIRIDKLTEPSFEKDKANGADKKHACYDDSSAGSNKDHNNDRKEKSSFRKTFNKKGRRVTVMRQTRTENAGIPDTSVTTSMKDSDDSIDGDGNDDDDSTSGQDEESTKKKTPARKKKEQKKARRNPISRRGRTRIEKSRAIIDPGTEVDVIGGVGWKVLSKVDNQVAQLDGALEGMGECILPLVAAVTARDHPTEGTVLFGAGCAGWDERPKQTESLFNSHDMQSTT